MHIHLDDPSVLADLRQNFERSGFEARETAPGTLSVSRPDAPTRDQEEREIRAHLTVWRLMHPSVRAEATD